MIILGRGTFLCVIGMYLGTTVLSLGSILLLLFSLPLVFQNHKSLLKHPLLAPYIFLCLAISLSIFLAEPFPFFRPLFKFRYFLCLFFADLVFSIQPNIRLWIMNSVYFLVPLLTLVAALQFLQLYYPLKEWFGILTSPDASGFLTHHTAFGLSMVYAFHLMLSQFSTRKSILVNLLIGILCALCVLSVLFSYSRGALLALVVSFSFIVLRNMRQIRFSKSILPLILCAMVFFSIFLRSSFKDRFTGFERARFSDRIELTSFAWDEFKKSPFLGHGFGRFPIELAKYPERASRAGGHGHAHNIFLDLLAGSGLLGFLSFLWFVLIVFKQLLRKTNQIDASWRSAVLGIWVAFLLGGLFDEYLLWDQILIPTMTLLGSSIEWPRQI